MTYVVLARKWRPMTFDKVIGQDHVTRTLMNALKKQRIAHAYIFAGPRGVGKTTTARLLAKAVNCENQPALNPCNSCPTCLSITGGTSMDVIEIDGASNRGIDEIRNLRENIKFSPVSAKYKIYIIDEVHMLTKEAFNALLKTLEEPPAHAIFIFATTEIHKVPATILSRCQRFDFKRISVGQIQEQLKSIVDNEKIEVDNEALLLISRKADGSMRDAESVLDQMISFSEGKLTSRQVRESLGIIEQEAFFEFSGIMQKKSNPEVLGFANKIINAGHDLLDFLQGLQEHFRNLLLVSALESPELLDVSDEYRNQYLEEAKIFEENDLIQNIQLITDAVPEIKFSNFPQLTFEMLLLKLTHKPKSTDIEEVLALIRKIKKNPEILDSTQPGTVGQGAAPLKKQAAPPTHQSFEPKKSPSVSQVSEQPGLFNVQAPEDISELDKKLSLLNKKEKKSDQDNSSVSKVEKPEMGLETFLKLWPKILQEVSSEKIALGSFLQEGIPYKIDEDQLILAYNTRAAFHREHIEKNKKFIEGILSGKFHLPFHLQLISIDFEKEGIEVEPKTPEEILDDLKNKEPVIKKIIETFELEDLDKMNFG